MKTLTKKSKNNNILIFGLTALVIFGLLLVSVLPAGFGRAQEAPASSNSPSPEPSPSTTPDPSVTPSATPDPSASASPTPSLEPSLSPTPTTSSEPSASPLASPEATSTPSVSPSASPEPSVSPGPTETATPTPTPAPSTGSGQISSLVCGNGIVEGNEQCDDNNLIDGDGCNSVCLKELIVPNDIGTGFSFNPNANQSPAVRALWEMDATYFSDGYLGQDDSTASSSQFMPSGKFEVAKPIAICAVASDPNGLADINKISGNVFYPQDIFLGSDNSVSQSGCGQQKGGEVVLETLSKEAGWNLFCERIRNQNNNLPVFSAGFDYEKICGVDGELVKATAAVACGKIELAYNDPSGDYKTAVAAQDKAGLAGTLENSFKYLELVAFEIDFDHLDYGAMRLNDKKIVSGDPIFSPDDGLPTVRNIGNTRLEIKIKQDDTGLGQDIGGSGWNVLYSGRVGSGAAFTNYWPETWTSLANSLNLSQASPLDLAIEIFKFPVGRADSNYAGRLSLSAIKASHLTCAIE